MLCFETKLSREPYLSALEAIPDGAELSATQFFCLCRPLPHSGTF